jgi:K+-transporting ATPase ATPase C chain
VNRTWETARSELRPLAGVTIGLLIITAVIYPLVVTGIGQAIFNRQANGSFVKVDGNEVGSSLIGQNFTADICFWPRPSAAGDGYDAANSSGSNLGATSEKLIKGLPDDRETADVDESFAGIEQRVAAFRDANGVSTDVKLPADSVTASASGLDPHISPATARLQVARVAKARGVEEAQVRALLDDYTEDAFLGFIGQPRVNVLKLNIALDREFPAPR